MPATIDSNKVGLTYAEEASLKVLPGSPVWYPLEANTYPNFGGDLKTVQRDPLNASRQNAKGTISDLDVTGGLNTDWTQNNITRLIQGFLFATAREKVKTMPINGTQVPITSVAVGHFNAAAGLAGFKLNSLLKSSGFANLSNNSINRVTAAIAASLTVVGYTAGKAAGVLTAEAAPPSTAKVDTVGFALSGDVKLYGPGSTLGGIVTVQPFLSSAATVDFTTLGLIAGEWVYLGDTSDALADAAASEYNFIGTGGVRNRGFCRVGAITATKLTFDLSIGSDVWALGVAGDGSCVIGASGFASMYFGEVIRNEPLVANIIRRTYSLQRYLGKGVGNLDNLEVVTGAVPNELTITVPSNNKLTTDLTFVGMDTKQSYVASLPGTYAPAYNEAPYNTSQDVVVLLLYIINTALTTQAPLFGFATDEKITVNNNTKPNKAIGVVGAFEANVGGFDVSGTLSCYFDDIAAQQAVRNNADVGLTNIFARANQGFVVDMPLLTLALPGLKVEKDKPVMADVTFTASPGAQNYTLLYNKFSYLPDSAMAGYAG